MSLENKIVGAISPIQTHMRLDNMQKKEKKSAESSDKDEQKDKEKPEIQTEKIPAELAFVDEKLANFANIDRNTKEYVASQIRPLYYSIDQTIRYFSLGSWERNIFVDI